MNKNNIFLLLALLTFCYTQAQESRIVKNIDFNWYFHLGDIIDGQKVNIDLMNWRKLDLPHDWSIEATYSNDYLSDKSMDFGLKSNGFLPGGIGWYRKIIQWNKNWINKKIYIEFEGVYMNSQVWINGHLLGLRPNGYIGFSYDITPYLNKKENIIAVRVDNSKIPSARWYTGSGIYRHVNLLIVDKVHVSFNGTYVYTPEVLASKASVCIETTIVNETGGSKNITLVSEIVDNKGDEVDRISKNVYLNSDTLTITQNTAVSHPSLWSPQTPNVYYLKTFIKDGKKLLDTYVTSFGIRKIEFGAKFGFKLNGKRIKFKGVCEHQDMEPFGTAVPEDALYRKLKILKSMGCNAIRTAHNPFSPEFYAMCDTMGIMVLDEPFDGWEHWANCGKPKWDYGHYFSEWWQKDLKDFIIRDRNHPSIMIWSMGNEVWGFEKHLNLQKQIYDIYHALDPIRPVTQAWALNTYIDIAGFNANGERKGDLLNFHKNQPNKAAIGTEIPHTRQTRGVYRTITSYSPWDKPNPSSKADTSLFYIPDLTKTEIFNNYDSRYASGYDNQTRNISIREEFKQVRDNDFFMGDFRWTGFDYLGESWGWPARTNNYGVIDLAGFPKDDYYLYQSLWTDKPMIHILPHWTHPGLENVEIPVVVYTNGDSAELFLNGKSLGKKAMNEDTLQIVWLVPYQPGKLVAVAYKDGKEIARDETATAGKSANIQLKADKKEICANKRDLVFIEVNILDAKGNFVPIDSGDTIRFEVTGPYKLMGVENGDILDVSPQKVLWRKTFMGKALLVLQATDKSGIIYVKAKATGLKSANISISVTNKCRCKIF